MLDISLCLLIGSLGCGSASEPPLIYSPQIIFTPAEDINEYILSEVARIGDIDGDGVPEWMFGFGREENNFDYRSIVRISSGGSVETVRTHGFSHMEEDIDLRLLRGIGDVNGDGTPDYAIGVSGDSSDAFTQVIRVYSGSSAFVLYTFRGNGLTLSGAGDVNADGFDDFLLGDGDGDFNGEASGTVWVMSGHSGAPLYTWHGDSPGDRFGTALSAAGDVDGDGFDDVIIGARRDDNNGGASGSARVFSGADGSILYTFNGDSAGDTFGRSVSGAGDVNGDGFADVMVGAWKDDDGGEDSGSARLFSGADGSVIKTFFGHTAGQNFGESLESPGDLDGDGVDDVIVGPPSGTFRAYSGCDRSRIAKLGGVSAVRVLDDINGDGRPDLIATRPGTVQVLFSRVAPCRWDCFPPAGDGVVNFDDLIAVIQAVSIHDPRCDVAPDSGHSIIGDGDVDLDDILAVFNNFGDCAE